ncbi:substrate-binding domain-containing protein [Haloarchaeobius sp. HRN-SO-5]|uniref:substrate-binding domain-containing protein n=1 Tax=Haloarchaeobius sp. HRN-SO-5 TaxID=3446118 RepID=UPI003EBF94DD
MSDIGRRRLLKLASAAGATGLTGLSGCLGGGGGGSADSLSIGVVTDTSGPYAHLGNSVIRGLKLGLAQALDADTGGLADSNTVEGSGITVEIIAEDSELAADTGRQKARKLVQNDQVDILQGSVSSSVAAAVQDVATDASKPMFIDTAAATSLTGENCNKYTFRLSQTTYQDALAGGAYAANNLGSSFYFVGADYSWGKDSVAQWKSVIEDNGGTAAGESYAAPGTSDFTPYLQNAQESGADAMVVALTGTDGIRFSRDLADAGADFNVTATGVTTVPWMQQVGTAAMGFSGIPKYFWTFPDNDTNDWIIEQYSNHWDTVPSIFTAGAHASGYAIAQGMQAAGSSDADPLIEEWHGMTVEKTARGDGNYHIRECDHQAEFPMYLGHFEESSDGPMDVEPVLDETFDAESSIRPCGETGCTGIEL